MEDDAREGRCQRCNEVNIQSNLALMNSIVSADSGEEPWKEVHMFNPKILALVMAGGEGKRLYPLTRERSKPAVPFGGRYRVVDFVLSNLVNSKIFSVYLLVQYKSQSLIEHIRRSWGLAPIFPEQFVTVVPPQMR